MKNILKYLILIFTIMIISIPYASATDFYVDSDGSGDFTTIAAAVGNVSVLDGDIIYINLSTYYEHDIIINKEISLIGNGGKPTINTQYDKSCSGSVRPYSANAFVINSNNVMFENISTYGLAMSPCVMAVPIRAYGNNANFNNINIRNGNMNQYINFDPLLYIVGNNSIFNNIYINEIYTSSKYWTHNVGITIASSNNVTISNSNILNSYEPSIHIANSNYINIINNTMNKPHDTIFVNAIISSQNSTNLNISYNNLISNGNVNIGILGFDSFVYGNYPYGLNNSIIKNNTFNSNLRIGIYLDRSSNNIFSNNSFAGTTSRFYEGYIYSTNNTILNSNITDIEFGIYSDSTSEWIFDNDGLLYMGNETDIINNITDDKFKYINSNASETLEIVNMTASTNISTANITILEFGDSIDTNYKKEFTSSSDIPTLTLGTTIGDFPESTPVYIIRDNEPHQTQTTSVGGLLVLSLTGWSEHNYILQTILPQLSSSNNSNFTLSYNTSDMDNYTATINYSILDNENTIITTYMPIIDWNNNTGFGYDISGNNILSYEFVNNTTTGIIDILVTINGTSNFSISPQQNEKANLPIVLVAGGGLFGLLTLLALKGFKIIKL